MRRLKRTLTAAAIKLTRRWRAAARMQQNVSAARQAGLRSRDNEYERISSVGRYPPR